jgi:ankyrin repeat protein
MFLSEQVLPGLEAEADVKSKHTEQGQTPLSWAAGRGHEAVVKQLLEAKADVNSKNDCGIVSQNPNLWSSVPSSSWR